MTTEQAAMLFAAREGSLKGAADMNTNTSHPAAMFEDGLLEED